MITNDTTSSADPDEMAHYEPSHLDLHCLRRYLYQSKRLKEFRLTGHHPEYHPSLCSPFVYSVVCNDSVRGQ